MQVVFSGICPPRKYVFLSRVSYLSALLKLVFEMKKKSKNTFFLMSNFVASKYTSRYYWRCTTKKNRKALVLNVYIPTSSALLGTYLLSPGVLASCSDTFGQNTSVPRAEHWVTQPVAILASKSISILDCSSMLSLLSPLSSRDAFSGFPWDSRMRALGVRKITTTGEYTGQVNQQVATASRYCAST